MHFGRNGLYSSHRLEGYRTVPGSSGTIGTT